MTEYKLCVFGSGGVGKSCLTMQFVQGIFLPKYDPTIEDVYKKLVEIDGRQYSLEILDTAGTEEFSAMRDLYVKNSHGFVLVYSIISRATFNDLDEFYNRIIHIKDPDIHGQPALVLVGNKTDLEADRTVQRQDGLDLSKRWKCTFLETSAKNQFNVQEIFYDLVRQINKANNKPVGRFPRQPQAPVVENRQRPQRPNQPSDRGAPSTKTQSGHRCILL